MLYPVIADPVSVQVRPTVCETACTPVPESVIVAGEPAALLVTVTVPFRVPAVAGSKITLKVRAWPAFKVTGAPAPFSE